MAGLIKIIFTIIMLLIFSGCSGDGILKSDRAPEPLDTSAPILSMGQMNINNNSASTLNKNVLVSLQGSNTKLNVTHFCLRLNNTTSPTSGDSCWNSVSDSSVGLTPAKTLNLTNFPYSLGTTPGIYTIFAWIKDALGNISSLTNSSEGTSGRDKDSIYYDVGSPPSVTVFTVTNGTAGGNFGTTTFTAGNTVNISWTVTDTEGLSDAPVTLEYSTNNSTYTSIAAGTAVGTTSGNPTTWSSSYNIFTAPAGTFFRLRLTVTDAVGNTTTVLSTSMNTGKWSIFAGTNGSGDGGLATASEVGGGGVDHNGPSQNIVQMKNGDIYLAYLTGIRKITAATGIISNYMTYGSEQNIPGTIGTAPLPRFNSPNSGLYGNTIIKDNNDNIYAVGPTTVGGTNNGRIYKINTNTNAISIYAGGGTSNADGVPATSAIVMDFARLSINPNNNDLYFTSTCNVNNRSGSGYIIRKVSQNEDGTAGVVTTIAGDCTRGWPVDGATALSSPLENSALTYMHGLFYSPSTDTFYYSTYSTNGLYKIVNGKIYKVANYLAFAFAYKPSDNAIYATTDLDSLIKIVPTNNQAADDMITTYIPHHSASTGTNCNQDGVLVANACALASAPFVTPSGALAFADGPMRNSRYSVRVRIIDEENKIRTVAGLMGMSGNGKDKLMARFLRIRRLLFKSTGASNQALFPGGLYIGDGGANAIGHIDLSTNIFTHRAGNMVSKSATIGSTFSANVSLGGNYFATAGGIFSFDAAGLMTFYGHSNYIYRVDSSGLIQSVLTGNGNYYNAADGATASSLQTQHYGSWAGMPYDNNGNLYIGPQTSSLSGAAYIPKFMRVNIATNRIYKVMGGTLNATSADDATAGSAISKNFACSNGTTGIGACQMEYDTTNDRLLFAEGNKIRYITTPYNTAASTLRTLLDAGRAIGAFSYVPGNNWVYYLSGTSLYCYDLSAVNPAGCNNTAISISAQLGNLSIETITRDASGNVYVINSAANLVYKYVP